MVDLTRRLACSRPRSATTTGWLCEWAGTLGDAQWYWDRGEDDHLRPGVACPECGWVLIANLFGGAIELLPGAVTDDFFIQKAWDRE